ncbi:MAG: toprim domain-containing protein [Thermoplasmata archaeon]
MVELSAKDNTEKMLKSIEETREKNKRVPIIVEGRNDVIALRRLDFSGEIIKLHSRMSVENFSMQLSRKYSEVILLLDWDQKGRKLTSSLIRHLTTYDVKADFDLWKLCFSMTSQMSNVESLPSVFYRLISENGTSRHISRTSRA